MFINDPAHAKVWNYAQLDLNSTGNGLPSMNGSDLVWNGTISWTGYGDNPANKQEVFYYNGTEIIQITDRIGKDEDSYLGYDKLALAGLAFEDSGHYKTNIYVYNPETDELELSMAPFLYQDKVAYSWFDDDGIKQLIINLL